MNLLLVSCSGKRFWKLLFSLRAVKETAAPQVSRRLPLRSNQPASNVHGRDSSPWNPVNSSFRGSWTLCVRIIMGYILFPASIVLFSSPQTRNQRFGEFFLSSRPKLVPSQGCDVLIRQSSVFLTDDEEFVLELSRLHWKTFEENV